MRSGLGLFQIGECVLRLNDVHTMVFARNHMQELPSRMVKFKDCLRKLHLTRNRLEEFPEVITELTQLEYLDVGNNMIRKLPESIGNLTKLERFLCYVNYLDTLPESFGDLESLLLLSVTYNKFKVFPRPLLRCRNLSELRFARCLLTSVPEEVSELTSLTMFDFRGNYLTEVPESISEMESLLHVSVSGNRLDTLPKMGNVRTSLSAARNGLTRLPKDMCSNVELVFLAGNKLRALEEGLGLTRACHIQLHGNVLRQLPQDVGTWERVTKLSLSSNELESLPDAIGNLVNCVELQLARNRLCELPDTICSMRRLERLNLRGNRLVSLPNKLLNMAMLRVLNVSFNLLTTLPPASSRAGQVPAPIRELVAAHNLLRNDVWKALSSLVARGSWRVSSAASGRNRQLRVLNLGYNRITTIMPVVFCSLSVLCLSGNRELFSYSVSSQPISGGASDEGKGATGRGGSDGSGSESDASVVQKRERLPVLGPGILNGLKELSIADTGLKNVGEALNVPPSAKLVLQVLDISCNDVATLPDYFGSFPHLRDLHVAGNRKLAALPASLAMCPLRLLEVHDTAIQRMLTSKILTSPGSSFSRRPAVARRRGCGTYEWGGR